MVAHEITRQAGQVNVGEVAAAIRAAVAAEHGIGVHTVVLLPPGSVPKTTSGKVQRGLCAAMFADGQLAELGRSTISPLAAEARSAPLHLDRASLLCTPAGERQGKLRDYLSGLVASACGIDPAEVAADAPLLILGIDSCAAISIQHSIQANLRVRVTASDLAHAASLSELAVRLDEQIRADAQPSRAEVPASASVPRPTVMDSEPVRLYCWVSGSRVPA